MSYHVKGDVRFKDLPERILVREDGYMTAYVFEGEPIADYWYVPESECLNLRTENAKLRELCVKALEWLRWAGGITCPPEVPDEFADELRELGIEVDA